MKRGLIAALVAAALVGVVSFTATAQSEEPGPIVDTYAVNVNGNPAGFVAEIKKLFEATAEIEAATDRRVLVSEIGGAGTNMVFVTVQYPSYAAMEAAQAEVYASEAWAAFMEATTGMGMAPVSRQVLRQLLDD